MITTGLTDKISRYFDDFSQKLVAQTYQSSDPFQFVDNLFPIDKINPQSQTDGSFHYTKDSGELVAVVESDGTIIAKKDDGVHVYEKICEPKEESIPSEHYDLYNKQCESADIFIPNINGPQSIPDENLSEACEMENAARNQTPGGLKEFLVKLMGESEVKEKYHSKHKDFISVLVDRAYEIEEENKINSSGVNETNENKTVEIKNNEEPVVQEFAGESVVSSAHESEKVEKKNETGGGGEAVCIVEKGLTEDDDGLNPQIDSTQVLDEPQKVSDLNEASLSNLTTVSKNDDKNLPVREGPVVENVFDGLREYFEGIEERLVSEGRLGAERLLNINELGTMTQTVEYKNKIAEETANDGIKQASFIHLADDVLDSEQNVLSTRREKNFFSSIRIKSGFVLFTKESENESVDPMLLAVKSGHLFGIMQKFADTILEVRGLASHSEKLDGFIASVMNKGHSERENKGDQGEGGSEQDAEQDDVQEDEMSISALV